MKEKVFVLCQTKDFRGESYGDPDITLCKTQEIAHREFLKAVESELDEYIDDEDIDDEDTDDEDTDDEDTDDEDTDDEDTDDEDGDDEDIDEDDED